MAGRRLRGMGHGFRVSGLIRGLGSRGLGFRVWDMGLGSRGLGFRVWDVGLGFTAFTVHAITCRNPKLTCASHSGGAADHKNSKRIVTFSTRLRLNPYKIHDPSNQRNQHPNS